MILSEREEYEDYQECSKITIFLKTSIFTAGRRFWFGHSTLRYLPSNEVVYEAVNDIGENVTS